MVTSLAIAFHNCGVECEYLKLLPQALAFYRRGIEVCTPELGEANPLTAALCKSLSVAQKAQRDASEKKDRSPERIRNVKLQKIPEDSAPEARIPSTARRTFYNAKQTTKSRRNSVLRR